MNLLKSDIDKIKNSIYYKSTQLSSGNYYIKETSYIEGIMELLGKILSDEMTLLCPEYYLVFINNLYYTLSADLNDMGCFYTATDLGINSYTYSISQANELLKQKCNMQNNITDLLKIYFIDILFSHYDRSTNNWGVLYLPDDTKRVVIFDNSDLIDPLTSEDEVELSLYYTNMNPPDHINRYLDFQNFITGANEEFIKLFKYYYDLINPSYFQKQFNALIEQHQSDKNTDSELMDNYVQRYQYNYEKLIRIYKKHY